MSGGIRPCIANMIISEIWRIDLDRLEWYKMEYSLKTAVFDNRMCVVNDYYLYTFGGYHDESCANTFERFNIRPIKLYHLCLESISHSPNMRKYQNTLPVSIKDELNSNENDTSFET
ncbi:hypothetical protein RF11_14039 [Thelohanellus kitauei]|uniref:Kelch domain-containing protein 10 n=1 Tax=Thelohanellus kitauei TaxID=669202 RepID=A0A0C2JGV5_THEKT|nr:hypothetical protein RF11_14039 [Thelohanellus kitauei]